MHVCFDYLNPIPEIYMTAREAFGCHGPCSFVSVNVAWLSRKRIGEGSIPVKTPVPHRAAQRRQTVENHAIAAYIT